MASAIVVLLGLAHFLETAGKPGRFADYSAQMVSAAVNDTNHVDVAISDMKQA